MRVVCVKQGTKYGPEYVTRLKAGIERYAPPGDERDFVCLTDKPVEGVRCEPLQTKLKGWWSKMEVFRFAGRTETGRPTVYFDLDVVITGDLTRLFAWHQPGCIKDWWTHGYHGSVYRVMSDNTALAIWRKFIDDSDRWMEEYRSDQEYLQAQEPGWSYFPRDWFASYKANHCEMAPPPGAMAVVFHGDPKPAAFKHGWVPPAWKGAEVAPDD